MKLILFDIDGTILQPRGIGKRAMGDALRDVLSIEIEEIQPQFAGRTDTGILNYIFRKAGRIIEARQLEELKHVYLGRLKEEARLTPPEILPGVVELLEQLKTKDKRVSALLTGNMEAAAQIKLDGLANYFPFGAYGDKHEDRNRLMDVALQKFKDIYGVAPKNSVVIGDTPKDITCARFGGATAVAVTTGPYKKEELQDADLVVDTLADKRLLELL